MIDPSNEERQTTIIDAPVGVSDTVLDISWWHGGEGFHARDVATAGGAAGVRRAMVEAFFELLDRRDADERHTIEVTLPSLAEVVSEIRYAQQDW